MKQRRKYTTNVYVKFLEHAFVISDFLLTFANKLLNYKLKSFTNYKYEENISSVDAESAHSRSGCCPKLERG